MLQWDSAYQARIAEEEIKLRWLMTRHPGSRELAYYLIFLLTANEQYTSAIEECGRVLKSHPDDVIAHLWIELAQMRSHHTSCL